MSNEAIALVEALRQRDANTGGHSDRTQSLALELGRAMALSSAELTLLELAAHLHDVGKIGIPDAVLLKPGRLDADELDVMRTHAQRGHDILVLVPNDAIAQVAPIVLHHHEAYDGTGYPLGLKGEAIPVLSRIVSIADSYDALADDRPYHRGKAHDDIMRILFEQQPGKYDPQLVRIFDALIQRSPHRAKGPQPG